MATGRARSGRVFRIEIGLCGVLALLAAEFPWLKVATPRFTDTPMLNAFDERFIDQVARHVPLRIQPAWLAKSWRTLYDDATC